MSHIVNGFLHHNMTELHGIPVRSNSSFPTTMPVAFQPKPQWSPGDIGTLVFGGIASFLGVLTLWAKFWPSRHRIRTLHMVGDGTYLDQRGDVLAKRY